MSKKISLILILLLGFLFRLFLIPKTFHTDLIHQAEWGQRAYQENPQNFYQNSVWIFSYPNHPPLTILYYRANFHLYRQLSLRFNQLKYFLINRHFINPASKFDQFTISLDQIISPEIPFPKGYLLTLKLFPIFADIIIALIIFNLAKKSPHPLLYPSLFLFMPFSFYISSLWGQTDQLAFLFLILSFILLIKKPSLSIILFYLSVAIKPTSVFLIPLFLFLLIKNKTKITSYLIGIITSFLITFISFKPFYSTNIFNFTFHTLLPRLTDRPPRLSTNIYNFWHIFTLNQPVSSNIKILFLSATTWSFIFFTIINIFIFQKIKKINLKTIFNSLFVISFGSSFFLTNMLDRYAFAGIVFGLIISLYYPKILKYWLILALIFSLNIYRLWWYPSFLEPLKYLLTFQNYLFGLPLSLTNFFCFIQIFKKINQKSPIFSGIFIKSKKSKIQQANH